jgi:hypothetical protein
MESLAMAMAAQAAAMAAAAADLATTPRHPFRTEAVMALRA